MVYDKNIGHEVLQTDDMSRLDLIVGKAINDWHRILQNNFFRLRKVIDRPAADLLEAWAWRVHEAGHHDRIPELLVHRIPPALVEALAEEWQRFVAELCQEEELDRTVDGVVQTLLGHAPISMWAAKEAVRRLRRSQLPDGDDIVARTFGSEDFRRAVKAFAAKEKVVWEGR